MKLALLALSEICFWASVMRILAPCCPSARSVAHLHGCVNIVERGKERLNPILAHRSNKKDRNGASCMHGNLVGMTFNQDLGESTAATLVCSSTRWSICSCRSRSSSLYDERQAVTGLKYALYRILQGDKRHLSNH